VTIGCESDLPHNCSLTISARLPGMRSWLFFVLIRRSDVALLNPPKVSTSFSVIGYRLSMKFLCVCVASAVLVAVHLRKDALIGEGDVKDVKGRETVTIQWQVRRKMAVMRLMPNDVD